MNKINCLCVHTRRWTFQTRHTLYAFSTGLSNNFPTRSYVTSNNKLNASFKPFKPILKNPDSIRIGCASGFWGDTPTAVGQLLNKGNLDFLVLDYLSEVTMSLLVAARLKNENLGWCPDFAQTVGPFLSKIKNDGVRVVTNAGGINSLACMETMLTIAKKMGVDLKIVAVLGDDLLPLKSEISDPRLPAQESITSMNAYFGAGPITRALDMGADIVICGRCTDSALALGPCVHTFRWPWNHWDLMASGSLAGHLIECGAQSTGGICTDWDKVPHWEDNGFPIAICHRSGEVEITKPEDTGGIVNRATVSEQLLYEIHDPTSYILPDCICDFSQVKLIEQPNGSVRCIGAQGKLMTPYYKVGGTYQDGWKCTAVCPIIGPRAVEKAEKTAKAILDRCRHMFSKMQYKDFTRVHMQVLGSEQAYGEHARKANLETRDGVLWISVEHAEKKALEIFSKELASAGTGMAPGLTTVIGGRPKPTPVIRFFSYLHRRKQVPIKLRTSDGYEESFMYDLDVDDSIFYHEKDEIAAQRNRQNEASEGENFVFSNQVSLLFPADPTELRPIERKLSNPFQTSASPISTEDISTYSYKVGDLAWTRSGDKGDTCNIGVIAREKTDYPLLRQTLTAEKVAEYFIHKFPPNQPPQCTRYEVPGIYGLNFVLENSLGGGGIASLTPDPQGKGYGQMLLDLEIKSD